MQSALSSPGPYVRIYVFNTARFGRLVRWLSFVVCVGAFEEVVNQTVTNGYEREDLNSRYACKKECMAMFEHCAGASFVDGLCFIHDKDTYKRSKTVKKTGAVHYIAKPCKNSAN